MQHFAGSIGIASVVMFTMVSVVVGAETDPLKPRVPPDQLAAAKALKNPVPASPENIAKGKTLYETKGTCMNCHGAGGKGDGIAGTILNPTPRNFTNCEFEKHKTDGEMFWVIKNGIAGTGMVALVPAQINEEEAWTIIHYERSFCQHGG